MASPQATYILDAWKYFLQESELARNYHMPYALMGFGHTFRNPLLDYLLPSLLHVKLVAILDEALKTAISQRGLSMPRKYRPGLHGRIEFLKDQSLIAWPEQLHDVRDLRNLLAHDMRETVTWEQFDSDVDIVEQVLQSLNLVFKRPKYEFFGERSAAREISEGRGAFAHDYRYGVKEGDNVVYQISFICAVHSDGQ